MRPLSISDTTSVVSLQQEIQRSEESRYDHRLHGVLLVAQGMTCPDVARLLGDGPRSVEYWVHRYQARGLGGLSEGERSGRRPRLNEEQMKAVGRVLRNKPSDAGMRVNLWDGKTLSAVDREDLWDPAASATVPAPVPPVGLSASEAAAGAGEGRSGAPEEA